MEARKERQMQFTPEQRLVARIVGLAFLLGFIFSPALLLTGIRIYHFIRSGFDPLIPPYSFGWPLDEFLMILTGSSMVLVPTFNHWYSQFLKGPQWRNGRHTILRVSEHGSRFMGFFLAGLGLDLLLNKPLNSALTESKASSLEILVSEIALTVLCALVIPIFLSWYLFVQDKRREVQREKEA